jgi:glyoxylase-like metal-dependent hydrolase (beta-lactamase superfamily II)
VDPTAEVFCFAIAAGCALNDAASLYPMRAVLSRIVFAAVGVAAAVSALAQPINPVVREGVTEKISDHVYVIPDASVPLVPNVGIIVGTRGTFVVDTGLGPRNGEAVLRETKKVARGAELYLATTHFHPEHDLGASAFPANTQLLRSTDQQKDIDEFGLQLAKTFSGRSPFIADLLKDADFRKANVVFTGERVVDLGDVRVRLIAVGPNHTRGDTVFLVEPDGVLFSGDVAMKPQPAFASPYSSLAHWLTALDRLEQLSPKKIVPSHGPMGDAGLIRGYRTYLTKIRDRVVALKHEGKSVEAATETVTAEMLHDYPDRNRLGMAVRAAYNEAQ